MRRINTILLFLSFSCLLSAQPVLDSTFSFQIPKPMYGQGAGPVVAIDEAHNNIHTMSTGWSSMADLLIQDGFQVQANASLFTAEALEQIDILVIVNPLHESNLKNWTLPCPSAFSEEEIEAVKQWVTKGGSLFLVADHMPIGGAAQAMAKAFEVEWANCFDFPKKNQWPPASFDRQDHTLAKGLLTDSSDYFFQIDKIGTFTGSAFRADWLNPILVFDDSYVLKFPKTAWQFNKKTKVKTAEGWFQGAYGKFGSGKVVFMGEAAMYTTQLRRKTKIGMNSKLVPDNKLLALNIFRFLSPN